MRYIFALILFLFAEKTFAHVEHYKNFKLVEFDIYRNNELVGHHKVKVNIKDKSTKEVITDIAINIKLLGINIYSYKSDGIEIYKNNELIEFKSKTKDGSYNDFCNIKQQSKGKYSFNGLTEDKKYIFDLDKSFYLGTWWNHDSLLNNNFILGQSCRNTQTKITFLKKEKLKISDKEQVVQFFNITGDNLNVNVGYTENDLRWVAMDFSLKGEWNYKLKALD
ncbi:MAG: DUF6134 family protein [Candidatus Fonsibacter sp.]|jgi:hypothetical protein